MKKLTDFQKEFIANNFFENERFAGWKGIAIKLLEDGKCIVAGDTCIWFGGIGNFIKTKASRGAYGCSLYTFDLDVFLSSEYFKGVSKHYLYKAYPDLIKQKESAIKQLQNQLNELAELNGTEILSFTDSNT